MILPIAPMSGAMLLPVAAKADVARDWLNLPVDMNFLFFYYTYSNNETSINGAVEFYHDNDDYIGGRTLSQDPIATIEAHPART